MDDFIDKLINRKRELGVTNAWVSETSGVPEQTVAKVLNGTTKNPGMATLSPIAAALGISVETGEILETEKPREDDIARELLEISERKSETLVGIYKEQLKQKNRWIIALAIAIAAMVISTFAVFAYDITHLDRGWFQSQPSCGCVQAASSGTVDNFIFVV